MPLDHQTVIRLSVEWPFQCSNAFNTQTTYRITASDQAFPTCQAGARCPLCAVFFILIVSPHEAGIISSTSLTRKA